METIFRIGVVIYGAICYAIFFMTFLFLIGFVGNFVVPKTIDSGVTGPFAWSLLVDLGLLALFGLQHSVMARPGFKRWLTRFVPQALERSTYVLASSVALILLMWGWQPLASPIFSVENSIAWGVVTGIHLLGYGIVLYSTFLIDHFDLFGLRQVVLRAMRRPYTEKRFVTPSVYKLIRHPLYVGWMMAFWVTPAMTVGHFVFAAVMTGYILMAIPLEERDLSNALGEPYKSWRQRTPAFLPRFRGGRASQPKATSAVGEAR